jgi:hypothetical protein
VVATAGYFDFDFSLSVAWIISTSCRGSTGLPPSKMTRLEITLVVKLLDTSGRVLVITKLNLASAFGSRTVFFLADDPFCGLTYHFALLIQQDANGAGRFDLVGQPIFHGQLHNNFLACDFWRRYGDGELTMYRNTKRKNQNANGPIHIRTDYPLISISR